ncbi:MAG: hypothetical protein D6820_03815 [Lentisphaerae bacterium]|nr:MAG: hypothetical protein D6820_03815 [Lentisphaerota bacterium]
MTEVYSFFDIFDGNGQLLDYKGREEDIAYLQREMAADGSFRGRNGKGGDLYFTFFGAAAMRLLGEDIPGCVQDFITRCRSRDAMAMVDRLFLSGTECLLGSAGERKLPEDDLAWCSSLLTEPDRHQTHHLFLAFAILESVGELPGESFLGDIQRELYRRRTSQGGFRNTPRMGPPLVTATAAAVYILVRSAAEVGTEVWDWLAANQTVTGGFCLHPWSPWPDLLSTGTSVVAFRVAGRPLPAEDGIARFIELQQGKGGGYRLFPRSRCADVESTFYAILVRRLIEEVSAPC